MRLLFCTVAGLLALALPGMAADEQSATHGGLPSKEAGEGWIKLFDGATTFGWKTEGSAEVKDGTLVIGGDKEATATTTNSFQQFELNLEYRLEGKGEPKLEWKGAAKEFLLLDQKGWTKLNIAGDARQLHTQFTSPGGLSGARGSISRSAGSVSAPFRFIVRRVPSSNSSPSRSSRSAWSRSSTARIWPAGR
jgi:hypothetical protein